MNKDYLKLKPSSDKQKAQSKELLEEDSFEKLQVTKRTFTYVEVETTRGSRGVASGLEVSSIRSKN